MRVTNSAGTRVSADNYCNAPGCAASKSWSGPYPNGYGAAHDHGNASVSYFTGYISGNNGP